MPWCNSCQCYTWGFCKKYNKRLYISSSDFFTHPFEYVKIYYNEWYKDDITDLVEIADKYLTDDITQSICKRYKNKGNITFKQRKLLTWKILNCYEPKTFDYSEPKSLGCQVED